MPPAFAGNLCARFMQLSYSKGDQLLIRLTTKPPETKYPSTNVLTIELHRYEAWCMRRDWFNRPMSIHLNAFFTTWMQTASSLTIFKNCVDLFIAKRRSGGFLMGDYVKGSYYWVTAEKAWPCATGGRRSVFMNGRHYYSYSGTQCVSNASCCASGSLLSSEYFVCRYKSHMSALLWFYKILTIWNTTETLTTWMLVSPVGS